MAENFVGVGSKDLKINERIFLKKNFKTSTKTILTLLPKEPHKNSSQTINNEFSNSSFRTTPSIIHLNS